MKKSIQYQNCLSTTLVFIACLGMATSAWAASANDEFNPGANNNVHSVLVQADGKILVGGQFTTIGGQSRNYIARLNSDGTVDSDFNPGTNGTVECIAVQSDGKILVGGNFTTIGGQSRNYIARLNNDGSLDAGFNPGADSVINAIACQSDGKILVGGWFITIGGQTRYYLARLNSDGSVDMGFNPGADSIVFEIAIQDDGKILVGGNFTDICSVSRNHIARLNSDGSLDISFNPGTNGTVTTIAIQPDGDILVGGNFDTIGGVSREFIARLNTEGGVDTGFNPVANAWVFKINLQVDGKILVGGWFTTIGGQARNRIARLNSDGSVDTAFNPDANTEVNSIAIQPDNKILLGGYFTAIGGQTRNYIARLYVDGSVETFFNPGADNIVYSMAIQPDDKILVGGTFTSIGGQTRNYIARLNIDGFVETDFNPGTNSGVNPLAVQNDGRILVGGGFTTIGGQTRNRIARLNSDGSVDTGFNPDANSYVYSLAIQADGKILVSGDFTSLGGQTRNRIARLNTDGSLDSEFNPGANNRIYNFAIQPDGKILVGGNFTSIGGQTRNYIARLNTDGSVDSGFNPGANNWIASIAIQPDNKILLGGYFTAIGGQTRNYIARLNSDGSVDTGFNPGASSTVQTIVILTNSKIMVGGSFTTIGGQTRNYIARLNSDGSVDTGFNPGADNLVVSIAIQVDGKILAGGNFTLIGGQTRNRLARLSADEAALQNLSISGDGTTITWSRGQSSPEIHDVVFEHSTDLSTWTPLSNGSRISGGWQLSGQSFPYDSKGYIRGRGKEYGGANNGSSSLIESIRYYFNSSTITVTSPNGGENWIVSDSHDITWSSTGTIASVNIDYSTNNGTSWTSVVAGTANDGTYNWTVPNTPSVNCLVRISDAADGSPVDTSNTVFTISAIPHTITVISPNGGETLYVADNQTISWSWTGSISLIDIDYSTDNGSNWSPVVGETDNDGSYNWTIPNDPSTNCLVRVSEATNGTSDESNAVFTIAVPETVSTPTTPTGPSLGINNTSYDFSTSGSTSSLGHDVQYKFDWNDGADSGWLAVGTTQASHAWTTNGTYQVRAMARCASDTGIESDWSETHSILISDSGSAGYYNSPSNRLFITEVNWAAAAGGGNWISEVQITDISGGSTVQAYYNSGTTRNGPFTLWTNTGGANCSAKYPNILSTIDGLDSSGFVYYGTSGALELITQDVTHLLQASVRTYNGNYTRTFPALADCETNTATTGRALMIPNITNNSSYRPSVVLFNPSANTVSVQVQIIGSDGAQIGSLINRTLAGYEMNVITSEVRADTYDNAYVIIDWVSGTGRVMASGQTANNTTNDPAAHLAVQWNLGYANEPAQTKYLTEVNWAAASGGGDWISEVQIIDLNGGSTVQVYYNSGTTRLGPFTLWTNSGGAHTCAKFTNILSTIDELDSSAFVYYSTSGSLEFVTQDSSHLIQAAVRTYNGNFSRTFPALSDNNSNTAASGRMMIIPNISNNASYRPSLVLFNPSLDSVTVEAKIIGSDGVQIGSTIIRTVAGYEMNVITTEVRANTYDNAFIQVQVTSGSGRLLVSGQSANNVTNDPAAHVAVQGQ